MNKKIKIGDLKNIFDKYGDLNLKVKTPYGFKKIECCGVTEKDADVYEIKTSNNFILKCSKNHRLKMSNGHFMEVKNILPGQEVMTELGNSEVVYVKNLGLKKDLLDIQVEEVKQYYSNGILSHNSTFGIDLTSFLFFGKTQKPYTLSECFNKFLDVPTFTVSGGVKIDGLNYVIERVVTRTKKRTGEWGDASQKVKYYQVINGEKEELADTTINEQGEHSGKTNKIIKEAIGSEKDFGMIVMTTATDLFSLIEMGKTETGRLLSKWIGLFPLEEKDKLGKEKYKEVERGFKSKIYGKADLEKENELNSERIIQTENNIKLSNERIVEIDGLITIENQQRDTLLSTKKTIDENVLKIDINTINRRMAEIKVDGGNKKVLLETYKKEFETVKDNKYEDGLYKQKVENDKNISIEINDVRNQINTLKTTNKNLLESEYCPTCKRKYDGLDNSKAIKENEVKIEELIKKGTDLKTKLDLNKSEIQELDNEKTKNERKIKLDGLIQIIPVQIQNLASEYREKEQQIKDFNENKEAIDKNNQIEISLTNVNAKIRSFTNERDLKLKEIENYKRNIIDFNKKIQENKLIISEIDKESIIIKNWKVYLEMIGKNGISKMVLRKTLPIINSEISRLLEDVCDFDVEVNITDKNEVVLNIIKDGVVSSLGGASGFEKTASALALRCVLGGISTMPRPNFLILDEILGGVASENYENMRNMYRKIENNYQFILHVTHLDSIKDWHKNTIVVKKENNISRIEASLNNTVTTIY